MYVTYVFGGVAVGSAILFPLLNAIKSPGTFLKSLMGVGVLVALFGVSYMLSSPAVTNSWVARGITEGVSKMVGAGLIMFYMVMVIAVLGLIYSEVSKAFK